MNTKVDTGCVSFTAGEELAINRMVKLSAAGTVIYADAGEDSIGVTVIPAASGKGVSVKLWNAEGTFLVEAADTFAAGATLYCAADGKISDTVSGVPVAIANEACTSTDPAQLIEVIATSAAHALTSSELDDPAALTYSDPAAMTAAAAALTASDPTLDASDIADNTGGTASGTHELANLADGSTYANDHANIENNFATLAAEYNSLKDDTEANEGSIEAAIDDLASQKAILDALITDVAAIRTALLAAGVDLGVIRTSYLSALDILEANGMRTVSS